MSKPNRIVDWIYWAFTFVPAWLYFDERVLCSLGLPALPLGNGCGYDAIFVYLTIYGLLIVWSVCTLGIFYRAIRIKKYLATNKYLFIYITPFIIVLFMCGWFLVSWFAK